jgi:hypothetical protein
MAVYNFIDFPEWGFPFPKPRFVRGPAGSLTLINVPLISPEEIVDKPEVTELPHLAYDRGYREDEWRHRWYHRSYLLRFLESRFAADPALEPDVSDEARVSLSTTLLTTALEESAREGSKAILLFFPSRADFDPTATRTTTHDRVKSAVFSALRGKAIDVFDLTPCLRASPVRSLFIEGRPHYSAAGNAAVAACVSPILEDVLVQPSPQREASSR